MAARPIALIVEDDSQLAHLYCTALAINGIDSRRAADGMSALRALEEGRPDVVLLDLMLPTLSGYAVLREFAENPLTRDIPIIVITGVDPLPILPGATKVVAKPCDPIELAHIVQEQLGQQT